MVALILDTQASPVVDPDLESENNGIGPVRSVLETENQMLPFPLSLKNSDIITWSADRRVAITKLQDTELQLRFGHAEDCLEAVRGALIQLSWQFKNKVRGAEGAKRTRSYDRIVALDKIWQIQRLVYNGNRAVMLKMGSATELGPKYPELLTTECNARTAIEELNSTGQSSTRLVWFWSTA